MDERSMTIQHQLQVDCQAFLTYVGDLSDEQISMHMNAKWSVADVMQHLYLSARPVARLMMSPREVFSQWGKAEVPSRAYHEIEAAYKNVLKTGVKAPVSVSPRLEDMQIGKPEIIERFGSVYSTLGTAIDSWSARELDEYRIPHPVLGLLTVREMLYFTSIHTQHHLQLLASVQP